MSTSLIDRAGRGLDLLLAALLAVMVLLVFGNVVLRYAFNSGITVSEEVSRWLFVWLTFLGAVGAVKEHAHLGTDFLLSRLPMVGRRVCLALSQGVMLYCTWLLLSGAWTQTRLNADVEAPVTGASVGLFYAAGVVFAAASGLLLLRDLWRTLSGRIADADLIQVQESEDLAQVEELHLDRSQTFKP